MIKELSKVAVIVPVANNIQYLEHCLNSLLRQTVSHFEILLLDYGLSEEGLSICDKYIYIYNDKLKMIKANENKLGNALTTALNNTQCEYVTIVYPEDFVEENYIEALSSKQADADIVISNLFTYDEASRVFLFHTFGYADVISKNDIHNLADNLFFNTLSGKLIKTDILKSFENFTISEEKIAYYLYAKVDKIVTCSRNVYIKRLGIDRPSFIDGLREHKPYLISIIVPIYNVERYLAECINSLINQTYRHIEILLINDGSPDNSLDICNEYASKDSRIKVFTKENGGLSDARNYGLDRASGDFIYFVDSDDFLEKEAIEHLYTQQVMHQADIVMAKHLIYNEDENYFGVYIFDKDYYIRVLDSKTVCEYQVDSTYKSGEFVVVWGKLYRKDLFKHIRYPKGRIHEDEFITHKLYLSANKIVVINEDDYIYRIRNNSIMRSNFSIKKAYDRLDSLNEKLSDVILYGLDPQPFRQNMYQALYLLKYDIEANQLTADPIYQTICKKIEFFENNKETYDK